MPLRDRGQNYPGGATDVQQSGGPVQRDIILRRSSGSSEISQLYHLSVIVDQMTNFSLLFNKYIY